MPCRLIPASPGGMVRRISGAANGEWPHCVPYRSGNIAILFRDGS
jgi:hypothetical protein